jgi:hypothetical protein
MPEYVPAVRLKQAEQDYVQCELQLVRLFQTKQQAENPLLDFIR